ncbi:MAG: flagellar biosynthesis protein FlhA [Candidatus Eisenbacteria sp.]|nr:flagellar biosynthesis protein FlhA [Candidatus Eisenbacteria bacterium]
MATSRLQQRSDLLLAAGVLLVLAVMMIPVPAAMLDLLLVANLGCALLILSLTIYVQRPLNFNAFPTVLLLATLFRLALNVATTRQILLHGYGGKVIAAFGSFVIGGNYAVGAVAFLILVVIQFLVITKGAQRIAEVTARFTLDAMPGRQMAIDADLNAGLIDEHEARRRRQEISQQADFHGAMDGAAKFVRGDAVAAIVITLINILGGFVIGMVQLNMSLGEALRTFTMLTIGDGLVAQIPALIVSTASGILVTRTEGQRHLGEELFHQMLGEARAPLVAAGILFLLGCVPALPLVPFWLLAALAAAAGMLARREQQRSAAVQREEAAKPAEGPEPAEQLLQLDELEIEIGFGLIPLVDESAGGDLLHRVTLTRRQIAHELGFIVAPVRIRDNVRLNAESYVIKMRGEEIARGELVMGRLLAMGPAANGGKIIGLKVQEPVFGLPAVWITPEQQSDAEREGLTVVEPGAVLATHLTEVVRTHAGELLTRQDVQVLIDAVKATHPALVEELIPNLLTLSGVQQVLKRLLREQVSIRDLVTILEVLADTVPAVKDLDALVERCREALGRTLVRPYRDERGRLSVVTLDPKLEQRLSESIVPAQEGRQQLLLDSARSQRLVAGISEAVQTALAVAQHPILLCSEYLRPHLRDFIARFIPQIVVLSYPEVTQAATVQTVATVKGESLAA